MTRDYMWWNHQPDRACNNNKKCQQFFGTEVRHPQTGIVLRVVENTVETTHIKSNKIHRLFFIDYACALGIGRASPNEAPCSCCYCV